MSFDIAVVGNGPFGAAAARHLAEAGVRVALIGLSEPDAATEDRSIYASHYDEARLLRLFDQRQGWADATRASVAEYRMLEARFGTRFLFPTGALIVDRDEPKIPAELTPDVDHYGIGDYGWKALFPALDFPSDFHVVHERGPAGHLNPRALIRAQNTAAAEADAVIVAAHAVGIDETADGVEIAVTTGDTVRAGQVVIAAGAFANFSNLVPEPLPVTIENETYALGRVSPETGATLTGYPTVKYHIDDPEISAIYMVAPVRYPDGNWYIKAGANTTSDAFYTSLDQIRDWFVAGDVDRHRDAFESALEAMWPNVLFESVTTKPCILCRTPSGMPMIERIDDRRVVAVGGNGAGAKGSDHWGRQAAKLALDGGIIALR